MAIPVKAGTSQGHGDLKHSYFFVLQSSESIPG